MDYDVVNTTPAIMSGLSSVILASNPRHLEGVFEVHSLAVLGVTAVLADGTYQMRSCSTCKMQVREEFDVCQSCEDFQGFAHALVQRPEARKYVPLGTVLHCML